MITRIFRWSLITLFLVFMFFPIFASLRFSVNWPNLTLKYYQDVFTDHQMWSSMLRSVEVAAGVVTISLVLIVLAAYWTSTRWPGARNALNFLAILPFVMPGVILVMSLIRVYSQVSGFIHIPIVNTPMMLIFATSVGTFPYMYRAIDNAFRAIDVRNLTEAASSLGASPLFTLRRVIFPNVFPGILSGSLLAVSGIFGEFTVANLLTGQGFETFPVYVRWKGFLTARLGTTLAVFSFLLTVLLALAITMVTRKWSQAGEQRAVKAV
jgi:putative spermidine/putrescine transport system permease protein